MNRHSRDSKGLGPECDIKGLIDFWQSIELHLFRPLFLNYRFPVNKMEVLMKAFLITVSLFLSVAHAADRNAAYNAICKPMTFESEREACMAKVKNYSYFDDRGLKLCKSQTFDSSKVSCLDLIGDKTYEKFEMDHCLNQTFESEKLECLRVSGTTYEPGKCVQRDEAITELNVGIREMRAGNLKAADQTLSYLLNRFMSCPNR